MIDKVSTFLIPKDKYDTIFFFATLKKSLPILSQYYNIFFVI